MLLVSALDLKKELLIQPQFTTYNAAQIDETNRLRNAFLYFLGPLIAFFINQMKVVK